MATVVVSIPIDQDCGCCTPCASGKKCFQSWTAGWSCLTQTWNGPTAGDPVCLAVGTSTDWTQTSHDASGCGYQRYVPYDPKHCCAGDGDCSGLDPTATPALPFGGFSPPDCCACTPDCMIPAILCCGSGDPTVAPGVFGITLATVSASPLCQYNTVSPFGVVVLDVSALTGRTFNVPWLANCTWEDTFDVTAYVKLLYCTGDGSGCGACTPSTVVSTAVSMTISYIPGSAPAIGFTMTATSDVVTGTFQLVTHDGSQNEEFVDCCSIYTSSCTPRDPMANDALDIYLDLVVVVPCP